MAEPSEALADLRALEGDLPALERRLDAARLEADAAGEAGDEGVLVAAGRRVQALERLVLAHRGEIGSARAAVEELAARVDGYADRAKDAQGRLESAVADVEEAQRQVDAQRVLVEIGEAPEGGVAVAERALETAVARRAVAERDLQLFERARDELRSRKATATQNEAAARRLAGLQQYGAACLALQAAAPGLLLLFQRLAASAKDCGIRGLSVVDILAPSLAPQAHREPLLVLSLNGDLAEVGAWLERLALA